MHQRKESELNRPEQSRRNRWQSIYDARHSANNENLPIAISIAISIVVVVVVVATTGVVVIVVVVVVVDHRVVCSTDICISTKIDSTVSSAMSIDSTPIAIALKVSTAATSISATAATTTSEAFATPQLETTLIKHGI